jgi:hypothetical protein
MLSSLRLRSAIEGGGHTECKITALYRVAKFAEALPLAQQVLAIAEKALGPDQPGCCDVAQ